MPMGEYEDFDACVAANSDKEDPAAYCGAIKRQVEGKSIGAMLRSALKALEDVFTKQAHPHGDHACVCPQCGEKQTVGAGEPCKELKCPKCGTQMRAETIGENRGKSFEITKDADGNLRWLGIVSNNFRDHDNPPQIIEAKAHQEFEDYLDKGGELPPLMLWHTPGTEFGTTDFMAEDKGFLIATGPINKSMEYVVEKLAKEKEIGMSHGFEYQYSDAAKEIIGSYRIKEVSVLPLEFAANPWTAFGTIDKEKEMKPEKKSFLERVLGKDKVDTLAKSLGEASATLQTQVESKEVKPEVTPETKPPIVEAKDVTVEPEISEAEKLALKEIGDTILTVKDMVKALPDMVKRIEALETSNKALGEENTKLKAEVKKSQDEIVAQAWTPRSAFAYVASKAPDNAVKPNDPDVPATAKPAVDNQFLASMGIKQ